MNVTHKEAWHILTEQDDILILTHRAPDGDAVGSLCALFKVLTSLGKRVGFIIDTVPKSLAFLTEGMTSPEFEPKCVVTVDVGDKKLLGEALEKDLPEDIQQLLSICRQNPALASALLSVAQQIEKGQAGPASSGKE